MSGIPMNANDVGSFIAAYGRWPYEFCPVPEGSIHESPAKKRRRNDVYSYESSMGSRQRALHNQGEASHTKESIMSPS